MVQSCCAINCYNRRSKNSKISFFSFPLKNEKLLLKWIAAVGRADFHPTPYTKLCSKHFLPQTYDRISEERVLLNYDAIPTIFNYDTSQIGLIRKRSRPNKSKKLAVELPVVDTSSKDASYKDTSSSELLKKVGNESSGDASSPSPAKNSSIANTVEIFIKEERTEDIKEEYFSDGNDNSHLDDKPLSPPTFPMVKSNKSERERMIVMFNSGMSVNEICNDLGFTRKTVKMWIERWKESGCLEYKPKSSKKIKTDDVPLS